MKRTGVRVIIYVQTTIHSRKWGIEMQEFMRKFEQLNGVEAKVKLEHSLFNNQRFYCRQLQTINDDERIGVLLKDHEIFMDKQDVKVVEAQENTYKISDGRLTIIVKKM